MERTGGRTWPVAADVAVPAVLAGGQAVVFAVWASGGAEAGWAAVCGLSAVVAAAGALVWRRRAPAVVLAAVLLLDGGAEALGPEAAVAPALPLAVWVALFSLAVHGGVRGMSAGAAVATAVVGAPVAGASSAWALLDELLAGAAAHLLIVLCGRLRWHRVARRARVAVRLAGVARERDAAAAAERERLTRELHDAAGHHLSAVAVQSAAALRLVDSRPELAGEALAGAAATGRVALATLARLVDAAADEADDGPLDRRLAALCGRLADLGFPVTLAVTGRATALPGGVGAAAYGVAQESLTNAIRHAAGAAVTVRLHYGAEELVLTVANRRATGGDRAAAVRSGGRGLAGMRRRVEAAGGRLTAGPGGREAAPGGGGRGGRTANDAQPARRSASSRRPMIRMTGDPLTSGGGGDWCVRAVLPVRERDRDRARPVRAAAPAAFAGCALVPLAASPAAGVALLLVLHAAPLLWLRRAPGRALGAMVAVALGWSAASAAGLPVPAALAPLTVAAAGELIALYAVAARHPPHRSWPAPFALGAAAGTVLGLALAADPAEPAGSGAVVLMAALGLAAAPWLLPVWALGLLARARRGEGGRWERRTLDAVAARVGKAVAAERRRVAAGLQGAVAERTARLVRGAESGLAGRVGHAAALAEVTAEARRALAALRELLDMMDAAGASTPAGRVAEVRG
ncbi:histidine kinase [Streptomyces sp. NPDC004134]|uniref:sensor histidine kinase n=1 Tax=Streptomyces sp. NPDC004134 TaxID=3364691 RepID=UPI003695841A